MVSSISPAYLYKYFSFDGLAHFAQIAPSKLKYLYKYAGEMELTIGEFMFDFMLDMEGEYEKMDQFFIQQ